MKAVGFIIKVGGFDDSYEQKLINETDRFNFDILINTENECLEYVFWHEEDGIDSYFKGMPSLFPNFTYEVMWYNEHTGELSIHFESPVEPEDVLWFGIFEDILFDDRTCRDVLEVLEVIDLQDEID